ncbi:OmpW family protein [Dongia sp.]|uniref:OmpW/AlkL family protein n=1 Tax=Dongia sp. TaxID=1977262 RepID=UPI0035B1350E
MKKKNLLLAGLAVAGSLFFADIAAAQEEIAPEPGKSAGDFMIRLRGIGVIPRDNADIDPIGGDTELSNTGMPEVDFTYFFTDNIAVELIASTTHHNVSAKGTSAGDVDLGDVWLLPPTLLAQYHFFPKSRFSPYVGAGINYTIFYAVDEAKNSIAKDVDYENSIGWALQIGADYRLDDHWYVNADVKRLFLDTDVNINNGGVKADVDVDPWIFGMGIGYKF